MNSFGVHYSAYEHQLENHYNDPNESLKNGNSSGDGWRRQFIRYTVETSRIWWPVRDGELAVA